MPVYAFSGEGDDDNITIPGIGDVAIGNLSTSRQYVRLLTCAQVASVHHQALKDDDVDLQICTFVQKHCRPRGGLLNYLELPYCHFDRQPWIGGLFLLLWTFVLLAWLTAQVPFLIPSLNTMSKICNMSQAVAGVTFLAFGNGCADLFSMLAATLSGPGGMELAVGEVLGNGMFVFCGVQGVIALVTPFCVNSLEYIRDCIFYAVSVISVAVVLGRPNCGVGGRRPVRLVRHLRLDCVALRPAPQEPGLQNVRAGGTFRRGRRSIEGQTLRRVRSTWRGR